VTVSVAAATSSWLAPANIGLLSLGTTPMTGRDDVPHRREPGAARWPPHRGRVILGE
jgi:hypothetical protein